MPSTKYTLSMPDELLAALHAEHAATYREHQLPFAAWLRSIWRARLDAEKETQS